MVDLIKKNDNITKKEGEEEGFRVLQHFKIVGVASRSFE